MHYLEVNTIKINKISFYSISVYLEHVLNSKKIQEEQEK